MRNVVYKKKKDAEGTFRKNILETQRKHPERLLQPTVHVDKLTRRDFVNPQYVALYGNPYNKVNPSDPFIEMDLNETEDLIRQDDERIRRDVEETHLINQYIKYGVEYYRGDAEVVCMTCSAYNHPNTYHCFYCGQSLYLSKLHKANEI